mgnify:CR=1 FL=1
MERPLHVPILIRLVEAVLVQGQPPNPPEAGLRLEISSPATNLPGYYQSFQRTWVLPVPTTGTLQLALLPSKYLNAPRQYRVRFYRQGMTQPDALQVWEVPEFYKFSYLELVRSQESFDVLPPEVFAGIEVPGYEGWQFDAGRLVWDPQQAPPPGTALTLRYLQPLSLHDIVRPQ